MYILLNTSDKICKLYLVEGDNRKEVSVEMHRNLAKDLLLLIKNSLSESGYDWSDIKGLGVFKGPGSFTGLRIGITVLNTISDSQNIAIVGVGGDDWQNEAVTRLDSGENDKIVMPYYDRGANITAPRK